MTHDISHTGTLLKDLKILALDCQATGANPSRGHLLEIGWTSAGMHSSEDKIKSGAQAHLIDLPDSAEIPRAVQRITGITHTAQKNVVPAESAWQLLLRAAGGHRAERPGAVCPIVIHYARFETPFLRELHRRCGPPGSFPFQIVCSHEIVRRLLPDLPRRGLRAIAGYYGHCMPENKRSADHAIATGLIWQNLVQLLESACGIGSLEELIDWLAVTKPAARLNRAFPMDPEIRRNLPPRPGIYRLLHKAGDILYIGKAKSLKVRVNSYFRPKAPHAEHILEMLTQARGLDVTLTDSALEAAIQESDEIKRHSPPYNMALRRRRRQIAFGTKDLTRYAPAPDEDYRVGPLPAGNTVQALAALSRCLGDGFSSIVDRGNGAERALLGVPPEYAPETACLEAGVEMFRNWHQEQLSSQTPLRFLTALGARLWRERLAAQALEKTAVSEPDDTDAVAQQKQAAEDKPAWTADTVAAAIEAMIRQNAFLIRRARWFCLLSESVLVWSAAANSEQGYNRIVFESGSVVDQNEAKKSRVTPVPPGYAKSFRKRQNNIDLPTYDRLRVVTTEMRRIIAEGRQIELALSPNVILGRKQMSRALQWV
jgi:DNA polymerase III epsilon subunit-like protein